MNGCKILKCFRKEKRISGELPCPATGLIFQKCYSKHNFFICGGGLIRRPGSATIIAINSTETRGKKSTLDITYHIDTKKMIPKQSVELDISRKKCHDTVIVSLALLTQYHNILRIQMPYSSL